MPINNDRTSAEQYGIDFLKLMEELLPYFFLYTIATNQPKSTARAYFEMFVLPLNASNAAFVAVCTQIVDKLAYTGQTLSLETLLNDKYDLTLRRIFIINLGNNFGEGLDIYNNDEVDPTPIVLYNNGEPNPIPITLFNNDEITGASSLLGIAFIVNIPIGISIPDELIRALLDIYVAAPRQYRIIRF